jgi:CubicO group peptidase (beta-lactamase class C family)
MAEKNIGSSIVFGSVAPGFEAVRREFEHNFTHRKELGAAFAVYHRGQKVVDLWGGHLDKRHVTPWQEDTVTTLFSSTKGVAALTLAHAHSRGLLEWDEKVATYWPEFAQAGKQDITVRTMLAHQAGLSGVDEPLDTATLANFDKLAVILARQAPAWVPGTRHGYHAVTLGWFQSELLRRVDPERRSLGVYFRDEIAQPLGLDIYIGLPDTFPVSRIALIYPIRLFTILALRGTRFALSGRMILSMLRPNSLTMRAFGNPRIKGPAAYSRNPALRAVEIPSANGLGDARSMAKLYSIFAMGGRELGISQQTLDDLAADPMAPSGGVHDLILRAEQIYSLGFTKPDDDFDYGSSGRAFGTPGAGGSFCFADPDAHLGMAYIMNQMGGYLVNDPREKALRDATYRAVAKFGPGA